MAVASFCFVVTDSYSSPRSLASLGQLWLRRELEWACQFMCAYTSLSK